MIKSDVARYVWNMKLRHNTKNIKSFLLSLECKQTANESGSSNNAFAAPVEVK